MKKPIRKVLVTGCAGFIGSHASEFLLSQGMEVIGIDNFDDFYPRSSKEQNLKQQLEHPRFTFYEADIRNEETFRKLPADIDLVLHLAAKAGVRPSIKDPAAYISINIGGTQTILEWMAKTGIRKLIFASSSSVYGNSKTVPFSETDNVDQQISPYAMTKKSCELLNYTYHHLYNVDVINLRLFTVFGPRQRPDLAIRKFIELIRQDLPVTLYGDGNSARDYTYVEDIVAGIYRSLQYLEQQERVFEIINLGNHKPVLLHELVDTLYDLLKKKKNVLMAPMQEGDVDLTCANIDKAKHLLGYEPRTSLREGFRKFLDWMDLQPKK
jgi:UDP-glucuronate 4-epimerase